jgi:hypothetical protein
VVLLYPTSRIEFALDFPGRTEHETEVGQLRDALQRVAGTSRQLPSKWPSLGCREALAHWEAIADVVRSLIHLRAKQL